MKKQITNIEDFMNAMENEILEISEQIMLVYEKGKIVSAFGVNDSEKLSQFNLLENTNLTHILDNIIDNKKSCNLIIKQSVSNILFTGVELKKTVIDDDTLDIGYFITDIGIDVNGEHLKLDDVELNIELPIK